VKGGNFMKRRLVSLAVGSAIVALLAGSPADAGAPTQYDSKNFTCTSTKTTAAVKMWEYGKSGVKQFEMVRVRSSPP
jgi:hypothetical protein